jgi:hypothetical protein
MKFFVYVLVLSYCILGCPSHSFKEGEIRVGHIVINEVLYNLPEGRDLEEWVELYNNSDHIVNLKGWTIDDRDTHRFEFRQDLNLSPGQYLLCFTNEEHGKLSPGKENKDVLGVSYQTASGKPLNLQIWNNDGDEILLKDATGIIIDYIEFGDPDRKGRDPQPDKVAWQGNIPTPPPGYSIALFPNGYDMNSSANWGFRTPKDVTPGGENFSK